MTSSSGWATTQGLVRIIFRSASSGPDRADHFLVKGEDGAAHAGGMNKLLAPALALAVLSVPSLASASNPASAWADVEEVTFEPNAKDVNTATKVIIKGVFAKSNMDASFPTYAKPQRGYFYYTCPADKLDLCRLEWKDIVAAIGTTNCAGWGDGLKTPGTIYDWCAAKPTADTYPLHMGVQRTPWANGTCDGLKAVSAPPTCSGTDGGVSDSGTTDTGTATTDTGTSTTTDTGTSTTTDTGTSTSTDTGTTTTADTGTAPADPPKAGTDDGGGCSMGSTTSVAAPFALALVALGLISRHSRRKGAIL
jgi:hypothetical protein